MSEADRARSPTGLGADSDGLAGSSALDPGPGSQPVSKVTAERDSMGVGPKRWHSGDQWIEETRQRRLARPVPRRLAR